MTTPNLDRIRLWRDELKNGEHVQGQLHLTTVGKDGTKRHCCLGVACLVAIKNGLSIDTTTYIEDGVAAVAYDGEECILPTTVAEWYGISASPMLKTIDGTYTAVTLNDIHRLAFPEIADSISKTYLGE